MLRRGTIAVLFVLMTTPAWGLVTRLTPLADMLDQATFVVTVTVESLDEKRPAMMLAVEDTLKGKPLGKKLPVLLTGDSRAKRLKETPDLLKRLEAKQTLVVFVTKVESDHLAFVYTNGTWFSLSSTVIEGELRWSFTHLEPYLRQTFKGTTAEMIDTVKDAVAGKKKPPAPDSKEKPGLGPELESKKGAYLIGPLERPRAVIPTVLVGGPLALLALLFPTVFGGWQRWLALLSTAGTNLTLVSLQWWFAESLVGSWWGTPIALWTAMTVASVLGLGWAWRRHVRSVQLGVAPLIATRVELLILLVTSGLGGVTIAACRYLEQALLSPIWLPVVAFIAAMWAGTVYVAWTWLRGARLTPSLATEAAVLTGLVLTSVVLTPALATRAAAGGLVTGEAEARATKAERVWTFTLPEKGAIASSPRVEGDRVYVAAAHDNVFRPYGALYCLDRGTGKPVWAFHDGKKMKQVFSSPVVVGDKVYIGEGFHQDFDCKVYCLDAGTGKKVWEHQTTSHAEATPAVVGGKVYIGAGDDGIFCLSADKGEPVWNFPGFHIDASAAVEGDRLYVGCGVGDVYKTTMAFCLDVRTGKPVWRVPTKYPVWSRPVVSNGFVYVASGNGRLNESATKPGGEVLCLRAGDGSEVWKQPFADGVLARMTADRERLYVGCRDGSVSARRKRDGELVWRRDLGSPVVAGSALEVCSCCEAEGGRLYVGSSEGLLMCLEPATGRVVWSKDLVEQTKVSVELLATPAVEARGARRVYVGLTLVSAARVGELHCYEEREE